jgi:hypothetical protein
MSDNDILQMFLGTNLDGLFDPNALVNSATEDPSGPGGDEFSLSLSMRSLINVRQRALMSFQSQEIQAMIQTLNTWVKITWFR